MGIGRAPYVAWGSNSPAHGHGEMVNQGLPSLHRLHSAYGGGLIHQKEFIVSIRAI